MNILHTLGLIPRALNAPLSWIGERSQEVGVASDEARAATASRPSPAVLGQAGIANAVESLPPDDDFDDYYEGSEIGCVNCDGGWRHGCCDDLCRGSKEPEWCDKARACPVCNPRGEIL